MKKMIVTLMCTLCVLMGVAQPAYTAEIVGLPQEVFDATKNIVFTGKMSGGGFKIQNVTYNKTENGVTTKSSYKQILYGKATSVDSLYMTGTLGMNLIHDYIYEYNCAYQGMKADTFMFLKPQITFSQYMDANFANGYVAGIQTFNIPKQECKLYQRQDGYWVFKVNTDLLQYQNWETVSGKRVLVTYTIDQLAALKNGNKQKLIDSGMFGFIGKSYDPTKTLVSIFPVIQKEPDGSYSNRLFINGKQYNNISITSLYDLAIGKNCPSYVVRWIYYNECTTSDYITSSMFTGNFGECWRKQFNVSETNANSIKVVPGSVKSYDASTHTLTYDSSKQWAVLEWNMECLPATGKQRNFSGYWRMPSGSYTQDKKIERLPRGND